MALRRAGRATGGFPGSRGRWLRPAAAGLLALATILVFLPAVRNGFVFDDREYILENELVRPGLSVPGVLLALSSLSAANWHPLTWISHQSDVSLFGFDPRGHHLSSILAHAMAAALLFLLLGRLTGALWSSLLAACLFALHPLRVESVAWVAERKDVLSGLLFLATLLAWRQHLASPRRSRKGLTLLLYALGLAAKPMLVTLPFLLLLLDWWPLGRLRAGARWHVLRALAAEKIPFLLLALGTTAIAVLAQVRGGTISTLGELPVGLRLENAAVSIVEYLRLGVWPRHLLHFYEYPPHGWPAWRVALSGVLLVGGTLLAFREARRRPYLAAGWAWYLVTLLPVLGLVQIGAQRMADRYTYLPLIGPAMSLSRWLAEVFSRSTAGRLVVVAITAVALPSCVMLTRGQVAAWGSEETLWVRALGIAGGSPMIHNQLGLVLDASGRRGAAETQYRAALRLDPDHAEALANLGVLLAREGRGPEALVQLERAASLSPRSAALLSNLGLVLHDAGRGGAAKERLREALLLDPGLPEAHNNLGVVLAAEGSLVAAAEQFRRALDLREDYAEARANLERALLRLNRPAGAAGR